MARSYVCWTRCCVMPFVDRQSKRGRHLGAPRVDGEQSRARRRSPVHALLAGAYKPPRIAQIQGCSPITRNQPVDVRATRAQIPGAVRILSALFFAAQAEGPPQALRTRLSAWLMMRSTGCCNPAETSICRHMVRERGSVTHSPTTNAMASSRAHALGLITLADAGLSLELVGFPPFERPKRYQLYGHWKDRAYWSWREVFLQIAFATELVADHKWSAGTVWFEVGLDVALIPLDLESPVLLAEVKTDPRDVAYVMEVMRAMSQDPRAHVSPAAHTKLENAANKYHALAKLQPSFYVEVAPGLRNAYGLSYVDRGEAAEPQVVFGPTTVVPFAL